MIISNCFVEIGSNLNGYFELAEVFFLNLVIPKNEGSHQVAPQRLDKSAKTKDSCSSGGFDDCYS